MGLWSLGLGAIGAAVAGIFLANTNLLLTKPAAASLEYLEETELQTLGEDKRTFKAKELWEKTGAVIMAVRRPG
ncbi:F213A protein, partial [Polyodon spathula]|nr:F213A protein [Polyodon spathula]